MKSIFAVGDRKEFEIIVTEKDVASFNSGKVHPVYATFALGRDAEWCCRLFVLDMKEADEEGIGTALSIVHHSPALLGEKVLFKAWVQALEKNSIVCKYEARVGERLIASGEQGQKILKKEKLEKLFNNISSTNP
ncbi:MAG: thioesterase family protein [Bacteroidia bacterium]|jgi:predicted thioesterase